MQFDYTAQSPDFKVVGEVVAAEDIHNGYIVPSKGSFYATTLKVVDANGTSIKVKPDVPNVTASAKTDQNIAVVLTAKLMDDYVAPLTIEYQHFTDNLNSYQRMKAALVSGWIPQVGYYYSEHTQVISRDERPDLPFDAQDKVGFYETTQEIYKLIAALENTNISEEFIVERVNELVDLSRFQLREDSRLPIPNKPIVNNLNTIFLDAPKNIPETVGFMCEGGLLNKPVTLTAPTVDCIYFVTQDGITITAAFSDLSTKKVCNAGDTIVFSKTEGKFIYNGEGTGNNDMYQHFNQQTIELTDNKQLKEAPTLATYDKTIDGAIEEIYAATSDFDPSRQDLNEFENVISADVTLTDADLGVNTRVWYLSAAAAVTYKTTTHLLENGDLLFYHAPSKTLLPMATSKFILIMKTEVENKIQEIDVKQNSEDAGLATDIKIVYRAINEILERANGYRPPIADVKDLYFNGILNPAKTSLQTTADLGLWFNKSDGNRMHVICGDLYDTTITLYPDDLLFVVYNNKFQRNDVVVIPFGSDFNYLSEELLGKDFNEGDAQLKTVVGSPIGDDILAGILAIDNGYINFNRDDYCNRLVSLPKSPTNNSGRIIDALFLADASTGNAIDRSTENNGQVIAPDLTRPVNRLNIFEGLSKSFYYPSTQSVLLEIYMERTADEAFPGVILDGYAERANFHVMEGLFRYYEDARVVNSSEVVINGVTWIGTTMVYKPTPASPNEVISRFNRLDGMTSYHSSWVEGYIPTAEIDGSVRINGSILESDSQVPNWSIIFKKLPNGNFNIEPQSLSLRPGVGGVTVTEGYATLSNVNLGTIENIQAAVGEHCLVVALDNNADDGIYIYPLRTKGQQSALGLVNTAPLNIPTTVFSSLHVDTIRVSDTEYHNVVRWVYKEGLVVGVASAVFTYTDGIITALGEVKKHPVEYPAASLVLKGKTLYQSVDDWRLKPIGVIGEID